MKENKLTKNDLKAFTMRERNPKDLQQRELSKSAYQN
jgi:hypothetical protein